MGFSILFSFLLGKDIMDTKFHNWVEIIRKNSEVGNIIELKVLEKTLRIGFFFLSLFSLFLSGNLIWQLKKKMGFHFLFFFFSHAHFSVHWCILGIMDGQVGPFCGRGELSPDPLNKGLFGLISWTMNWRREKCIFMVRGEKQRIGPTN